MSPVDRTPHSSQRRKRRAVLALGLAAVASPFTARGAERWPSKPVRFFVGAGPGSAPDVILRLVADRLTRRWGHTVVVENKPGAGGILGTTTAANAPPDGYNFLFGLGSALAMNQFLYKSLPYNPEKDFVPVVSLGVTPMVVVANPKLPVTSIGDLVALARAQPGKVPLGTTAKSAAHLTMQSLAQQTGVEFLHAFYKSAPNAFQDMMAGQVMVFCDALAAVPDLKDPRIRVLAVTAPQRLPGLQHLPVVAETVPGFTSYGWYAVMAPPGTPADVVATLNADVNAVISQPEVVARLQELVTFDAGGSPAKLATFIQSERERLRQAARVAGIEPE
jgi:tripartite-type tricarboxylate transporter receptor subunit TctC